ncbi:M16 family metallopeptidase [Schlesneria paludicola]|uniref:M16 family metallopeptidase n=1 Tax=Schlesneria paludicola TaxID=360056 RepID=UPI0002D4CD10|nr:insulinase family protein [Schlesneria paludicola]
MFKQWSTLAVILAMSIPATAQVNSFRLTNGVAVSVNTIEQADTIAMEMVYHVGFLHEPEGMVQAAHLLEHLVCCSPCEGFAEREAMQFLNQIGLANAETLPTLTHYDYLVPKDQFLKVLQIERDRIQRFTVERQRLVTEAKRCYQETDVVEANPSSGMLKHAFMACSHAWRFQSDRALVRGGMEAFDIDDLKAFHMQYYNPKHLTIAITGAITAHDAREALNAQLSSIPASEHVVPEWDWNSIPKHHSIRWDSKVRGVCIAWKPPAKTSDGTALSILGLFAMQSLSDDAELKAKCHHVSCSNNSWIVGDLPLFAYASLRDGEDIAQVEALLISRFETLLNKACATVAVQLPLLAAQAKTATTWRQIRQTAPTLMQGGRKESEAIGLCMLQDALNRIMQARLLGQESEAAPKPSARMSAAQLTKLVRDTVTTESRRVVHILPLGPSNAGEGQ